MTLYEFLSDPVWQSVGALISGLGVFVGAWYGTKLANKKQKSESEADNIATRDVYIKILNSEMAHNKRTLETMKRYMMDSPSIEKVFDTILSGSKHLRFDTFHELVRLKIAHLIEPELLAAYEYATNTLMTTSMVIDMETNNWKRSLEFSRYYKEDQPELHAKHFDSSNLLELASLSIEREISQSIRAVSWVLEVVYGENSIK